MKKRDIAYDRMKVCVHVYVSICIQNVLAIFYLLFINGPPNVHNFARKIVHRAYTHWMLGLVLDTQKSIHGRFNESVIQLCPT